MSTWIALYEAQRSSALLAYGYDDLSSRTPGMSDEFARLLINGWVSMGNAARDSALAPGVLEAFPDEGQMTTASYLNQAVATLQGDSPSNPRSRIWTHVFSLASTMDQSPIAAPSYLESLSEIPGDAAGAAVDWLKKSLEKGLNAAKPVLDEITLIVVGLAVLALVIVIGK